MKPWTCVEKLSATQAQEIFKQDPRDRSKGGFQSFMCELRDRVIWDGEMWLIRVDDAILGRARRYAYDYNNGGWQGRLERALGEIVKTHRA